MTSKDRTDCSAEAKRDTKEDAYSKLTSGSFYPTDNLNGLALLPFPLHLRLLFGACVCGEEGDGGTFKSSR